MRCYLYYWVAILYDIFQRTVTKSFLNNIKEPNVTKQKMRFKFDRKSHVIAEQPNLTGAEICFWS